MNYYKITQTIKDFPNNIIWSTAKVSGALIDNWTNVNLLTSTESDGNMGPISGLINYNNKLIGFQHKGIFEILFNSRVQIPTSDDNPIQVTSNYKVEGLNYLAKNIGTINKWSINNDSLGTMYFIDDIGRSLYSFPKFDNITTGKGFHTWSRNNLNKTAPWDLLSFSNYRTFYDNLTKDLYLVDVDTCLAYSQYSDQFTSFYEYYNTPYMFNISDKFIAIGKDRTVTGSKFFLWNNNAGQYNQFFGKNYGYHIELNANSEPIIPKIFDTIEYRAQSYVNDVLFNNPLFDKLSTRNENQNSDHLLLRDDFLPTSNLKGRYKV